MVKKGSIVTDITGSKLVVTQAKNDGGVETYTLKYLNGNKLGKGSIFAVGSHMKTLYKQTGKTYKAPKGKKSSGSSGG